MLVLDANILVRAVLGSKVLLLLREYAGKVEFLAPHTAFQEARERIARRDEDDWPVLAVALAFDCAIWTEDTDFFGCGVATWTTDRIELYLAQAACPEV